MDFNPSSSPFDEQPTTDTEFHHFQLVGPDGSIPMSISVLVRMHDRQPKSQDIRMSRYANTPISSDDVIELHEALESIGGNFRAAFSKL